MTVVIENVASLATYLELPTIDSLGSRMSDETLLRDVRSYIQLDKAPVEAYVEALRQGNGSDRITGVYLGANVDAAAPLPVEPRELYFPFPAVQWDDAWLGIAAEWAYLTERAAAND